MASNNITLLVKSFLGTSSCFFNANHTGLYFASSFLVYMSLLYFIDGNCQSRMCFLSVWLFGKRLCLLLLQDGRITDAANEAKDNVKYLYTLDKFFGPLVKCTPVSLGSVLYFKLCYMYYPYSLSNETAAAIFSHRLSNKAVPIISQNLTKNTVPNVQKSSKKTNKKLMTQIHSHHTNHRMKPCNCHHPQYKRFF